ncbi:hypothetical protein MRB53_036927 [Persea americana]|nr:hypothetical protein MRB53_036927 [Persea americana]
MAISRRDSYCRSMHGQRPISKTCGISCDNSGIIRWRIPGCVGKIDGESGNAILCRGVFMDLIHIRRRLWLNDVYEIVQEYLQMASKGTSKSQSSRAPEASASLLPYAFAFFALTVALAIAFAPSTFASPFGFIFSSSGIIVGHDAPNAVGIREYLGVPFGDSTAGKNRFAPPVSRSFSYSPIYASSYAADCPAAIVTTSLGDGPVQLASPAGVRTMDNTLRYGNTVDDDCLRLNVWSPSTSGLKAVMIRIPGGGTGFQRETTNSSFIYHGQYLSRSQDVVVVSVKWALALYTRIISVLTHFLSYRSNIFGFPGLPGYDQNVGLLDQRLAIEWVHKNIASFGGDPSASHCLVNQVCNQSHKRISTVLTTK